MNLEQFKVFKFERDKLYIVLFDPRFVNVESVEVLSQIATNDTEIAFVPCEDVDRGMKTVTFDSLEVLEEWVKQLKDTNSAKTF